MKATARRLLLRLLVLAVLAAVFLAYVRPGFMVDLSNLWLFCTSL